MTRNFILCLQEKFLLQDQEGEFGSCCSELKIETALCWGSVVGRLFRGVSGEKESYHCVGEAGRPCSWAVHVCQLRSKRKQVEIGVAVIRELEEQDLRSGFIVILIKSCNMSLEV